MYAVIQSKTNHIREYRKIAFITNSAKSVGHLGCIQGQIPFEIDKYQRQWYIKTENY
jgi:hypothetical protein